MRSRLLALLLPALVLVGLLLPATLAYADTAGNASVNTASGSSDASATSDRLVLATESGGEAPGPDPQAPNDENNPGRPKDYPRPPIWWGAVIFVGAGVLMVAGVGGGYWLLVTRAAQKNQAAKASK